MTKRYKEEAIKRLNILRKRFHLMDECVKAFSENDEVWASEWAGILYTVNDEVAEKIKTFEATENAKVYHVIKTNSNIGLMYSFLYVSKYEDEWALDISDLEYGQPLVYVWNATDDWLSEKGYINITGANGGLVRTG